MKYPFTKQEEGKDCGAACMQMIIKYYNGYLGMEKLRDILKISNNGLTAYHLVEGAKSLGFEASGVKCKLDDLNEDNVILPCIANVIINKTYRHYIVIYKINYDKEYLIVADPANKIMKISFDIFNSIFSGVLIFLYPNNEIPHEPSKNIKNIMIHNLIKSYPRYIVCLIIMSMIITLFSIIGSFFLQSLNRLLLKNYSEYFIILIVILFLIVNVVKVVTNYFRERIIIILNEKISVQMMMDTFARTLTLPYKNYRNKSTGDMVTRMLDVNTIKDNIVNLLVTVIVDLPLALSSLFILFLINTKLSLITLIILSFYLVIIILFRDFFDDLIRKIKKNNIDTTNYMIEALHNYETVKGLSIIDEVTYTFEKKYVQLLKNNYRYETVNSLEQLLKSLINDGGLVLIYGVGALLVHQEQVSFSSLLTFGALINYFYEPVKNIFNLEHITRELNLIIKRFEELDGVEKREMLFNYVYKNDIVIHDLSYSYNDIDNTLNSINLNIKKGEKVIILGTSGSGKSTLLKLLMKYYEVSRDKILINNIDINDYDSSKGINYISQNESLFTDSLFNNIVLFDDISLNRVKETIDICHINDIIGKNSLGLNMLVEEDAYNLSGGEKQRIILARTLLKPFNILLIDEGLNQIDINLERQILKEIFKRFSNKTIIIISHRRENIDLFDHKIVMEQGRIIEDVCKV